MPLSIEARSKHPYTGGDPGEGWKYLFIALAIENLSSRAEVVKIVPSGGRNDLVRVSSAEGYSYPLAESQYNHLGTGTFKLGPGLAVYALAAPDGAGLPGTLVRFGTQPVYYNELLFRVAAKASGFTLRLPELPYIDMSRTGPLQGPPSDSMPPWRTLSDPVEVPGKGSVAVLEVVRSPGQREGLEDADISLLYTNGSGGYDQVFSMQCYLLGSDLVLHQPSSDSCRATTGPGLSKQVHVRFELPVYAPDLRFFMYETEGTFAAVFDLASQGTPRFAETAGPSCISPGAARRIAYVKRVGTAGQVFLMNPDGSGRHQLTYMLGRNSSPDWSPDGCRIAFASDGDGTASIWTLNADGGDVRRLTGGPGQDQQPRWSPDGRRIAFASSRDAPAASTTSIYIIDADGGGETRLTFGNDSSPSWSPDGTRIAYLTYDSGQYSLVVSNADGSGRRSLLTRPGSMLGVDWSPDGSRIAYGYSPGPMGETRIYVVPAYGPVGSESRLTNGPGMELNPAWSPDGRKIAFTRVTSSGNPVLLDNSQIYVMSADGSDLRVLTTGGGSNPRWSP